MKTLGIYFLATGNYVEGIYKFSATIHKFFPDYKKTVIIISDGLEDWNGKELNGVTYKTKYINHYPWPIITLFKMYYIYNYRENFDYILYVDSANYYNIDFPEIDLYDYLIKDDKIILTRHAMADMNIIYDGTFFNCYPNSISVSYISPNTEFTYVQAGIFFGPGDKIFKMCYDISKMVESDLRNNQIPKWHDETYLNKWAINNKNLIDNTKNLLMCIIILIFHSLGIGKE